MIVCFLAVPASRPLLLRSPGQAVGSTFIAGTKAACQQPSEHHNNQHKQLVLRSTHVFLLPAAEQVYAKEMARPPPSCLAVGLDNLPVPHRLLVMVIDRAGIMEGNEVQPLPPPHGTNPALLPPLDPPPDLPFDPPAPLKPALLYIDASLLPDDNLPYTPATDQGKSAPAISVPGQESSEFMQQPAKEEKEKEENKPEEDEKGETTTAAENEEEAATEEEDAEEEGDQEEDGAPEEEEEGEVEEEGEQEQPLQKQQGEEEAVAVETDLQQGDPPPEQQPPQQPEPAPEPQPQAPAPEPPRASESD